MARLVNKQFNSPIGLYSEQNIREVIERESQILSNGAVGINFNNPGAGKPSNLQNSAVLRMLEEEEQRQRSGQSPSRPLQEQITWPPPDSEHVNPLRSSFKDVITPGLKRVAWPPPNEGENYVEQQGGPQYSSQSPTLQNNYPAQQQVLDPRYPLKPLDISNGTTNQQSASQSPVGFRPATASKHWAPVHSPVASPTQPSWRTQASPQTHQPVTSQAYQPISPQPYQATSSQPYQAAPTQTHQATSQQTYPVQQQYINQQPAPVAAINQVAPQTFGRQAEPPPSTITLRSQAPVSQAPPPVVTSQPATATLKGGKHLRGDLKWPPETVKKQFEEENRMRLELARGPACKPRLVRKDYGPFFAQHALNASYPGYKAPPGTQFYEHGAAY